MTRSSSRRPAPRGSRAELSKADAGEKASSRADLLKAASSLMIERGSVDISLSEIAERARLNSALVKYYFGNKNGLILALIEDVLGGALKKMAGLKPIRELTAPPERG